MHNGKFYKTSWLMKGSDARALYDLMESDSKNRNKHQKKLDKHLKALKQNWKEILERL